MATIAGELFYGPVWRIEKDAQDEAITSLKDALEADDDADFYDMLDDLSSKHDAHVLLDNGVTTIYFGLPISTVTEATNEFDEMALLRCMDLKQGTLRADIRKAMTDVLDGIPYGLRKHFSAPKFGIAWSAN